MSGLLGSLPPGLRGYQAQRQFDAQEDARGLQQITGLLGIKSAMAQEQLRPLQLQQLQMSIDAAKTKQDLIRGLTGGGAPGQPGQSRLLAAISNAETVARLKLAGIDLTDMYKIQSTPIEYKGGSTYEDRGTGVRQTIPKLPDGMIPGVGGVSVAPGFLQSAAAIAGAQEGARAQYDLVDVPDGAGGTRKLPRDLAAQLLRGQQPQPIPGAMTPPGFPQISPQVQAQRDADAAAIRDREATGTGIPTGNVVGGLGVTRPKLSETLTPGQKSVDEAFAKDYSEFVTGGAQSDQLGNVSKISDALQTLRGGQVKMGPMYANQPDAALAITNPQLLALKGNIADVVQRGLRPILGAQFTEKEGENLIKRAFDPNLPSGENAYRLDYLDKKMRLALQAKQDAVKYYEKNGTLAGFKGKLYSVGDFRNMKFDVPKTKSIALDDGTRVMASFDQNAGKYSVTRNGKKFYVEED